MDLDYVRLEGPFDPTGPGDTSSRRRIFICRPAGTATEEPCARRILSALARRAYRRPVTDPDVETLLRFYRAGRSEGDFERGVQEALTRLLVSPEFLFRVESDPVNVPAHGVYAISDLELASRLSFFLWSSIPDDELLDVAARGALRDPGVLERQVRRMLGDPRASALTKNFGGQWLLVRNLRAVDPDASAYPEFDDNLRGFFPARDRAVPREPDARGPADRGAVDSGPHVPERAAGPLLRCPERLRRAFPARAVDRSPTGRGCWGTAAC